jgi:hypothetical protein
MNRLGGINQSFETGFTRPNRTGNNEGPQFSGAGSNDEFSTSRAQRSGSANFIFTLGALALLGGGLYLAKGKIGSVGEAFSTVKGWGTKALDFFRSGAIGRFFSNLGTRAQKGLDAAKGLVKGTEKVVAGGAGEGASVAAAGPKLFVPKSTLITDAVAEARGLTQTTQGISRNPSGLFVLDGTKAPSAVIDQLTDTTRRIIAG